MGGGVPRQESIDALLSSNREFPLKWTVPRTSFDLAWYLYQWVQSSQMQFSPMPLQQKQGRLSQQLVAFSRRWNELNQQGWDDTQMKFGQSFTWIIMRASIFPANFYKKIQHQASASVYPQYYELLSPGDQNPSWLIESISIIQQSISIIDPLHEP